MRLVLDVPKPPSLNQLWRHRRNPRSAKLQVYLNPKYVAWMKQFGLHWLEQKPRGFRTIECKVQVTVALADSRMDTDNALKATLDALQRYSILANDKLSRRSIAEDGEAPLGCRITIEPFAQVGA